MAKNCSFCGAVVDTAMSECKKCGAPNEYYVPPGTLGVNLNVDIKPGDLLRFEAPVRDFGDRLSKSLGLTRDGTPAGFLELLVRGAFLDGKAYRQAAANTGGNVAAYLALAIPGIAGLLGALLGGEHLSLFGFNYTEMILTAIVSYVVLIAAIVLMAALSGAVLHKKLSYGEMLRGLAYAQSPGALAIIPVLGTILSLWRLVTSLVAIRELSGANIVKSGILLVIGLVSTTLITGIVSSLVFRIFAMF